MNTQPLTDPFADEELLHFAGRGGKEMTYVEDETVMDRLDAALGIGNWTVTTEPVPVYEGVVKVRLSIRTDDGWVSYEDYGYPNREGGEALKEAVSDGIRRCGRYLGIARDLYRRQTYQTSPVSSGRAASPPPARPSAPTTPPDLEDPTLDAPPVWEDARPRTAPSGGVMWSKALFEAAEAAGIERKMLSDTSKRLFGKDKWKVTDLTDGERWTLAYELGLVAA
jgi:hypothetical protein